MNLEKVPTKTNGIKWKFTKSILLVILFYIYATIFIFNPIVTLFIAFIYFLYLISILIWDQTKKIQSSFNIALFVFIITIILLDLIYLQADNEINHQECFNIEINEDFENKSNDLNIIFIETNLNEYNFDFKEHCAIESAAYNNPNSNVMIFSLKSNIRERLLQEYDNIEFFKNTPHELFNHTPLYDWYDKKNSKILKSNYVIEHLSDGLRLALLYKYGGIYSDLDTITVKNFDSLKNYTGVGYLGETINEKFQHSLGNGFLLFPKRNHKMLYQAMESFANNYNPKGWASNGPTLLKKVIKSYCQVNDIYDSLMIEPSNKTSYCDITLLPERYFYPYSWENVDELFKNNSLINIKKIIDSYSIHFYGKMSKKFDVKHGSNSIYEYFAKLNCPITYQFL